MREFADDPPVEECLGNALREADATVAVAESCTGGLISSLVTDVPGSSDYFDRATVTYSYDAKRDVLGVSREALDEHGAVSGPVACEMAAGIRDTADVTWGLSSTGIAGPTGGSEEKPVGTAFIGIAYAGPWGTETSFTAATHREFDGDRLENKELIARAALAELREAVEER